MLFGVAFGAGRGSARALDAPILEPRSGATLGMNVPIVVEAADAAPQATFRWTLRRETDGRVLQVPQDGGPAGDGFSESNRVLAIRLDQIENAQPGAFALILEARFAAPRPDDPPTVTSATIPVHFAREIMTTTGLAPGRVVAGRGSLVLYGRRLGRALVVLEGPFEESASGPEQCAAGRCAKRDLLAIADAAGETLTFSVPFSSPPGLYRVTAKRGRLQTRGQWLRVDPPRIEPPSRTDRHGMARLLLSGQTVREQLAPRGAQAGGLWDYQLYYFVAAEGSLVDAALERVDTSRSWLHPDELDPELYLVCPDGVIYPYLVGKDVAPGSDFNAAIRQTLPQTGLYFLIAGTTKGFGAYDLTFSLTSAEIARGSNSAILLTGRREMVRKGMTARSVWMLLDPLGNPISGAAVDFVRTPEGKGVSSTFVGGGAAMSSTEGLVAGSYRLDQAGLIALPAALYGPALVEPSLEPAGPEKEKPQVPRQALAGAATPMVRNVDLQTGDMLLSDFGLQKF